MKSIYNSFMETKSPVAWTRIPSEAFKAAMFVLAGLAFTIIANNVATPAGRALTIISFAWTCGMIGVALALHVEQNARARLENGRAPDAN